MKIVRTETFKRDYQHLPRHVQETFDKKIFFLLSNPHHPSFRLKKMKGHANRWEASITMLYRFTFEIHRDHYLLRRIGPHDILKNP